MRTAINGAWLFGIVITFTMIFIAYVSIMLNYAHAYKVQSAITNVIEEYQGVNYKSLEKMYSVASSYGYRGHGKCTDDSSTGTYGNKYLGVKLDGTEADVTGCSSNDYVSVCIKKSQKNSSKSDKYYYTVQTFFTFSLPVFYDLFTFRITGETNEIYYPVDDTYFNGCTIEN